MSVINTTRTYKVQYDTRKNIWSRWSCDLQTSVKVTVFDTVLFPESNKDVMFVFVKGKNKQEAFDKGGAIIEQYLVSDEKSPKCFLTRFFSK